jgi:hypothetical protein
MYLRWFLVILVFSHSVCSVLPVHAATEITLIAELDVRKQVSDQEQRSSGENQRGGSKQLAKSADDP